MLNSPSGAFLSFGGLVVVVSVLQCGRNLKSAGSCCSLKILIAGLFLFQINLGKNFSDEVPVIEKSLPKGLLSSGSVITMPLSIEFAAS